jgi:hypothetical protein
MINSYGKVWQLGHRAIQDIYQGEFHIEEKIDGSQFSFGIKDGNLLMRSKGQELFETSTGMFDAAIATVVSLKDKLIDGYIYRAEYLRKPKHNLIAYDRVPTKHLIIFDIEDNEGQNLEYEQKRLETERLGLEVVPLIYEKPPIIEMVLTKYLIEKMLNTESVLGSSKIEGIVVKNYTRFTITEGKFLCGKFVSEKFKEKMQAGIKKAKTDNDIVNNLILELRTEARWNKAIQHLREQGELEDDPRDIGKLMKELNADIMTEEADYIKEQLYKWAIKQITRGACRGFAEYYKKYLLEKSYE